MESKKILLLLLNGSQGRRLSHYIYTCSRMIVIPQNMEAKGCNYCGGKPTVLPVEMLHKTRERKRQARMTVLQNLPVSGAFNVKLNSVLLMRQVDRLMGQINPSVQSNTCQHQSTGWPCCFTNLYPLWLVAALI